MLVRSNILNYVTGLRIYGRVTNIEVVAINSDDSPKTGTAEFGTVVTGTAKEAEISAPWPAEGYSFNSRKSIRIRGPGGERGDSPPGSFRRLVQLLR
jgi:hypothetical protein